MNHHSMPRVISQTLHNTPNTMNCNKQSPITSPPRHSAYLPKPAPASPGPHSPSATPSPPFLALPDTLPRNDLCMTFHPVPSLALCVFAMRIWKSRWRPFCWRDRCTFPFRLWLWLDDLNEVVRILGRESECKVELNFIWKKDHIVFWNPESQCTSIDVSWADRCTISTAPKRFSIERRIHRD